MKEAVKGFARIPRSPRLPALVWNDFRRAERHPRCCSERGRPPATATFAAWPFARAGTGTIER